jgi:hypothetical protein
MSSCDGMLLTISEKWHHGYKRGNGRPYSTRYKLSVYSSSILFNPHGIITVMNPDNTMTLFMCQLPAVYKIMCKKVPTQSRYDESNHIHKSVHLE